MAYTLSANLGLRTPKSVHQTRVIMTHWHGGQGAKLTNCMKTSAFLQFVSAWYAAHICGFLYFGALGSCMEIKAAVIGLQEKPICLPQLGYVWKLVFLRRAPHWFRCESEPGLRLGGHVAR